MSSSDFKNSDYRIDIGQMLRDVYYSKHRELYRNFCSLSDFEDLLFSQTIEQIDENLSNYLSRGFNYLASQKDEGFVDFTFDDNNINFNHATTSDVRHYLSQNSLAHLYAHMALWLMDNTDIEDHLTPYYHLIEMSLYYMTFECRRYHAAERLLSNTPYLRNRFRNR